MLMPTRSSESTERSSTSRVSGPITTSAGMRATVRTIWGTTMLLAKYLDEGGKAAVGVVDNDRLVPIVGETRIGAILGAPDADDRILAALSSSTTATPLSAARLLAPIDDHEVWGAGVT